MLVAESSLSIARSHDDVRAIKLIEVHAKLFFCTYDLAARRNTVDLARTTRTDPEFLSMVPFSAAWLAREIYGECGSLQRRARDSMAGAPS